MSRKPTGTKITFGQFLIGVLIFASGYFWCLATLWAIGPGRLCK